MSERNLILFICTANICRSPMAQRLLTHALRAEPPPLRSLMVVSAGISAYGGDPASPNSHKVLEPVGLSLADHLSQRLTQDLVDRSFAIFCMTSMHKLLVESQFEPTCQHLYLMREFMPDSVDKEISDPYGMDRAAYEACRDSMVEAIPSILQFLRRNYRPTLTPSRSSS
jgi:protein-tyrosine phosphatase